ncbi:MAG TPA: hypothetical protein VF796_12925, partial [Humisphaera sp.]
MLAALRDRFPEEKASLEQSMREQDPTYLLDNYEQVLLPPVPVTDLPTFDPQVRRPLSPQLRERFAFGSTWVRGGETWFDPAEMAARMGDPEVRSSHESLREHFEGSPPNLLRDDQLTLFGMLNRGGGSNDGVIYLSWKDGAEEPEVFWMSGMNSDFYDDLRGYLE